MITYIIIIITIIFHTHLASHFILFDPFKPIVIFYENISFKEIDFLLDDSRIRTSGVSNCYVRCDFTSICISNSRKRSRKSTGLQLSKFYNFQCLACEHLMRAHGCKRYIFSCLKYGIKKVLSLHRPSRIQRNLMSLSFVY